MNSINNTASEVPAMKIWICHHHTHRFEVDVYIALGTEKPTQRFFIDTFQIDFESDREDEFLEIWEYGEEKDKFPVYTPQAELPTPPPVPQLPRRIGIGDRYRLGSEEHILAQVDTSMLALVSLDSGNRQDDPVKVEDPTNVTEEEWNKIIGEDPFVYIPASN